MQMHCMYCVNDRHCYLIYQLVYAYVIVLAQYHCVCSEN